MGENSVERNTMNQSPEKPQLNPWEANDPTNTVGRPEPLPPSPNFVRARNTALGIVIALACALFVAGQFNTTVEIDGQTVSFARAFGWVAVPLLGLYSTSSLVVKNQNSGLLPTDSDEQWQSAYAKNRWFSLKMLYAACIPLVIAIVLLLVRPHGMGVFYELCFDPPLVPILIGATVVLLWEITTRIKRH